MSTTRWSPPLRHAAPLLSADELRGVRALAASLPPPGGGSLRLKGRHIAIIGAGSAGHAAAALAAAATALGATVVRLEPRVLDAGATAAAELLGRLYDLIACAGVDVASTASMAALCRVPVLDCDEVTALVQPTDGGEVDRVLRALLMRLLG